MAHDWGRAVYTFGRYAVLRFWNGGGLQAASALTYSSLLALVPIATIAFSILSAFPAFGVLKGAAQRWLVEMLVPEVGHTVLNYLEGFSQNTGAVCWLPATAPARLAVTSRSSRPRAWMRVRSASKRSSGAAAGCWMRTSAMPFTPRIALRIFWA